MLTLGQPIGAIAAANPMISQHPWVLAATTTASVYNDDIQGTGGVRLAGLINTLKITAGQLKEQRVLFVGAEPAAIGLADLTVAGMGEQSVTPEAARQQICMFDTQGLVVAGRPGLATPAQAIPSKPFDHLDPAIERPQIVAAIEDFKPTVLIGINGKALKAVWAGPDPRLVIDLAETGLTENDRKSLEFNVCFGLKRLPLLSDAPINKRTPRRG